jgi:hypothetical protein
MDCRKSWKLTVGTMVIGLSDVLGRARSRYPFSNIRSACNEWRDNLQCQQRMGHQNAKQHRARQRDPISGERWDNQQPVIRGPTDRDRDAFARQGDAKRIRHVMSMSRNGET